MHRLKNSLRSVSSIFLLMFGVIVITGLIVSLIGYLTQTSKKPQEPAAKNAPVKISSETKTFHSPDTALSFTYPADWHVDSAEDPSSPLAYDTVVYAGDSISSATAKITIIESLWSEQLGASASRQLVNSQPFTTFNQPYYLAYVNEVSPASGDVLPALYVTTSPNNVANTACPPAKLPISVGDHRTCLIIDATLKDTGAQTDLNANMEFFKKSPYVKAMQDIIASMKYSS